MIELPIMSARVGSHNGGIGRAVQGTPTSTQGGLPCARPRPFGNDSSGYTTRFRCRRARRYHVTTLST